MFVNAQHIVTRWKRDASGMVMEREGHPVLEFVAIKRKSASLHWSIPEISEGAYHRLESFPTLARAQDESATKVYKKSPVEYVSRMLVLLVLSRNFEHFTDQCATSKVCCVSSNEFAGRGFEGAGHESLCRTARALRKLSRDSK